MIGKLDQEGSGLILEPVGMLLKPRHPVSGLILIENLKINPRADSPLRLAQLQWLGTLLKRNRRSTSCFDASQLPSA